MQYKGVVHYAWLLLVPFLLGCGQCCGQPASRAPMPSATAGLLISERRQVWHSAPGRSAQEIRVNCTATVGNGDQAWTQGRGRALLKFPDLWLRLYADTALHASDVTPTAQRWALGGGAAQLLKVPGVYDRVEIIVGDPPHARIVLTGTQVMVDYEAGERLTLLRVFEGAASVESAVTGAAGLIGKSEWGIVDPAGQVKVTAYNDYIRQLVRDHGRWELFHEIEQDVYQKPGPAGMPQLSPTDVVPIFEPGTEDVPVLPPVIPTVVVIPEPTAAPAVK